MYQKQGHNRVDPQPVLAKYGMFAWDDEKEEGSVKEYKRVKTCIFMCIEIYIIIYESSVVHVMVWIRIAC